MRRANIQADFARGARRKVFERSFQLETAPADILLVTADNFDFCIAWEWRPRLVGSSAVHLHFAGKNLSSGFFRRFGKAAFNEKKVEALPKWLWLHRGPEVYVLRRTRYSAISRRRAARSA